LDLINTRVAVL